jgi:hypothetical protein
MRFRLICRGILFEALTLLMKEKRGAGDLGISFLSDSACVMQSRQLIPQGMVRRWLVHLSY